jgi:magnesium transporter
MARFLKSRAKAKGAAPGSIIFIGRQKMESPKIRLIKYNKDKISELEFKEVKPAIEAIDNQYINWLNIDGLHDLKTLKAIGEKFSISPLILENIVNTDQRPRLLEDEHAIALITKAIYFAQDIHNIKVEQIAFVLTNNTLISFQEQIGDHFEPIRNRLRNHLGKIRTLSADYLMYALSDSLTDNYLIDLERIGDTIEKFEAKLEHPTKALSSELFGYKTEMLFFRKSIKPMKEVLTRILHLNHALIKETNLIYYKELYEIQEQANEAADNYITMINDLINLYNTNLSNSANQVMKVLSIFASIFIPLTFIAGIYGTNFDNLPELHYKYSYFIMWAIMLAIAGIMLAFFRKHKWF